MKNLLSYACCFLSFVFQFSLSLSLLFSLSLSLSTSLSAAPKFYTPRMIERRGLTDDQYEYLWSIGRNPAIDQKTARNWFVRSSQNNNFCDWLDTDGKSNELSRLTATLATNNVQLADDNLYLSSSNTLLAETNAVLVATNAVLEVDAKKAQKVERSAAKAKKKDQKNFDKWVKSTEQAKSKSSAEMAEFYDAVLKIAHAYEEAN